MKARVALALVTALVLQGCGVAGGCSDVGGVSGISAELARSLFVPSGRVALDVCDADGCAAATASLGPVPNGRVGREVNVSVDDLGQDFEPGEVTVTVVLSDTRDRDQR